MEDFLDLAHQFIKAEEAVGSKADLIGKTKRAEEEASHSRTKRRSKSPKRSKSLKGRRSSLSRRISRSPARGSNKRSAMPPAYIKTFTPLNTKRKEILLQIKSNDYVKWPFKMRGDPNNRNPNKYFHFHKDVGHDTENCRNLKNEIEDLIKRGYLRHFIKDEWRPEERTSKEVPQVSRE
ncbi:PREDICTED: uncharacterized protein LOC104610215 [Nelumbo nucifera]|uniref:Uncharacterized protein LOC104610215 n=1 Tax=Nelumbo nucifera TaxID=4432 RepID=A0A1U8BEA1_NELNU|nr:PREDICTED: uncharacterized protein LOC104610215 [Nelumbo nucifera]